jgi:MoxR-like ATPase
MTNPSDFQSRLRPLREQVGRVLVGQQALIDRLLVALLTSGHVLLEGVPGLAKTLAVRTLAQTLRLSFKRIQFTPDLLPGDVIGTQIYNPRSGDFAVKQGPVFAHLVLADEINRAPAKVQAALLEAMQERQVTLGDSTFSLPEPFLVLATQNPIEQEGTYPLPEAQLDRFFFKLRIDYPTRDEELLILDRMAGIEALPRVEPVLGPEDLPPLRQALDAIHVDGRIKGYMVDLVRATRPPNQPGLIQHGASPRATIFLTRAAKGHALLDGRAFVTPQDVKAVYHDVMRHRVVITYEAEAEEMTSETVLTHILNEVAVP